MSVGQLWNTELRKRGFGDASVPIIRIIRLYGSKLTVFDKGNECAFKAAPAAGRFVTLVGQLAIALKKTVLMNLDSRTRLLRLMNAF